MKNPNHQNLKDLGQRTIYRLINPVIYVLIRYKISPNVITTIGFAFNVVAALVFIAGAEFGVRGQLSYVGWGGFFILFGGIFDMIDGQLARKGGLSSRFGALYDSVLDRYSESVMFLGICYYLVHHHYLLSSLAAFVALVGSMMVSYTRARAEGLSVQCSVGFMQRPERIVIIGFSALICGMLSPVLGSDYKLFIDPFPFEVFETISIFTLPIALVAIWSNVTAIQRLNHCRQYLRQLENKQPVNS